MYIRGDCRAGKTWEIYKRYQQPCRIENGKVIKQKRKAREKPTADAVQKYNEKLKIRKLTRKINANFVEGDLYLTLTYPRDGRPDPAQAHKNLKNFTEALRRRYKKQGIEFKWVSCTEIGSRGGIHHHMIIPYIDDVRQITELWRRYGGHTRIQTLYGSNYEKLASYIAKCETKSESGGKSTYSCSRNLTDPPEKVRKVKADSWQMNPVVPAGWILEKDSLEIGINPFTGYGYQFYRLVQLE